MKTKCPFCGSTGAIGPISSPIPYRGGYLCGGCRSIHHVPKGEYEMADGTVVQFEEGHHRSTDKLVEAAKRREQAIADS